MARVSKAGTVLRALGHDQVSIAERVLRSVQLWERRGDEASTLTEGDLKLLEVARALATNPALLLLDEPYADWVRRDRAV